MNCRASFSFERIITRIVKNESARKEELRSAAAKLFLKLGYGSATVRDIAKSVGLQSGSIFYYFKTKEDILVGVMSEGMRQFTGTPRDPLRNGNTPLMKLRGLFIGHLKALHNPNSPEVAVVISEWRHLSPRSRRVVVKLRDQVDKTWDQVLREVAAEGLVQGDLHILRLSMLGALNWSLQWYDKQGSLGIEDLACLLLESFIPAARVTK